MGELVVFSYEAWFPLIEPCYEKKKHVFNCTLSLYFAQTKRKVKAEQLGIFRCQHMHMYNMIIPLVSITLT